MTNGGRSFGHVTNRYKSYWHLIYMFSSFMLHLLQTHSHISPGNAPWVSCQSSNTEAVYEMMTWSMIIIAGGMKKSFYTVEQKKWRCHGSNLFQKDAQDAQITTQIPYGAIKMHLMKSSTSHFRNCLRNPQIYSLLFFLTI